MPTIGSVSGTFGHGRSPQTAPQPGFTFFPPIGRTSTWNFAANGTFIFGGNTRDTPNTAGSQITTATGNCYVIVPNSTFIANVKIWGAGGGAGGDLSATVAGVQQGGAGGAVNGQLLFQSGQPYTVFAGAPGPNNNSRSVNAKNGGGGAASGIVLGNVFAGTASINSIEAVAGGGGGASRATGSFYRVAGAGGGANSQTGDYVSSTPGAGGYSSLTTGLSTASASVFIQGGGQAIPNAGAFSSEFQGGQGTNNSAASGEFGGGGGGARGGPVESGGQGGIDANQIDATTITGFYTQAGLVDDSSRGTAGDPGKPGRVMIFTDNDYKVANVTATGGTVTEVPIAGAELAYRYHTFTSSDKFTVSSAAVGSTVDVFLVGGGGGSSTGAGAGGGAVVLRTGLPITTGNYIVTVGTGGPAADSYSNNGIGRIYGGYRGKDTAFFTNALAAKSFPDSYWRLAHSFGYEIKYISPSGDDTTGDTQATAYTTIESAAAKTANFFKPLVFIVMSGTYTPQISPTVSQSPIKDIADFPRIFICAPGKVTINFTPAQATSRRDSPMAVLQHPLSAVYGATIVRSMFATETVSELSFFNETTQPGSDRGRGSYYNCVFRESTGKWALATGNSDHKIRIENCTFFTKDSNQDVPTGTDRNILLKNCVFNKAVTNTEAVLENCATNVTVGAKYVVTGVTDKGVYAGEYGWTASISVPEKTARTVMMVAQGGGGAGDSYMSQIDSSEMIGGCSPGNGGSHPWAGPRLPYTQVNHVLDQDYSSYAFPGGAANPGRFAGGGGAGYPGVNAFTENTVGGLGFEWPKDSRQYYGAGGAAIGATDLTNVAPGTVGKGANGGTPAAGNNGIAMIRYIVAGPYTAQSVYSPNPNLIAYGGQLTRSTATYKEHIFTTSGRLLIFNSPPGMRFEVIVIGGGGGGSGNGHHDYSNPGEPGQVNYYSINSTNSDIAVTVGAGGRYGGVHEDANGKAGSTSSVVVAGSSYAAGGGGGGWSWWFGNNGLFYPTDGTLITSGLYSDNTTKYAQRAGAGYPNRANTDNWGSYGSSGRGANYGWDDNGFSGLNGAVIIRYPIYPVN